MLFGRSGQPRIFIDSAWLLGRDKTIRRPPIHVERPIGVAFPASREGGCNTGSRPNNGLQFGHKPLTSLSPKCCQFAGKVLSNHRSD